MFGLGFRSKYYDRGKTKHPEVDFFEIISENFMHVGGRAREFLLSAREHYPIAMHGVGLSIGGADPLNLDYLRVLKSLTDEIRPLFVSDHLCWTSYKGHNTHDLLPIPLTEESLKHIASRVSEVQNRLDRRFYLENPSAYAAFDGSTIDESTFLAELIRRTGCGVILDVNNLFVNSKNLGIDPLSYLTKIPADAVAYFHLAGHSVTPTVRIDTHDAPVCDEVWELYAITSSLFPDAHTLVERDDDIPEFEVLVDELNRARGLHASGRFEPPSLEPAGAAKVLDVRQTDAYSENLHLMYELVTQAELVSSSDERLESFRQDLPVSAVDGINVYNNAYFFRIRDVIAAIAPQLRQLFEENDFNRLIAKYLAAHPPSHFDVSFAPLHLSSFLEERCDRFHDQIDNRDLARLVHLEVLGDQVYSQKDAAKPAIVVQALAEVQDWEWEGLKLRFHANYRVCKIRADFLNAVSESQLVPPSLPGDTLVYALVARKENLIAHRYLSEVDAAGLELLEKGASFGQLCAYIADTVPEGTMEFSIETGMQLLLMLIDVEVVEDLVF